MPLALFVAWMGAWPAAAAPPAAEEAGAKDEAGQPLQAGTDVPAPKRKRLVLPEYPEQAKALGVRGIVLLELTIERDGRVGDARVVRSIPELDAAALEAVRQWEYEVTRVDGRPVRVRLTVPITFSMKLPELAREEGVPELRQGVVPAFPASGGAGGTVEANVTLDANGRIAEAVVTLGDSPWSEALLRALRTWIFNWNDPATVVSFRLRAEFARGRKHEESRVSLAATGARRLEVPALPTATAESAEAAAGPARADSEAPPAPAEPAAPGAPPAPAPAAEAPEAPPATPPATEGPEAAPAPVPAAGAPPAEGAAPKPSPPPVEVIRVPPPRSEPRPAAEPAAGAGGAATPAPAPRDQPGFSSVQGVTLGAGVPDLTQGRRPVVPPFARMQGVTGTVEVSFSVGVSGATSTQSATGPDVLKPAAKQMVASWVFRRTSTERLYLVASIEYDTATAKATVTLVP